MWVYSEKNYNKNLVDSNLMPTFAPAKQKRMHP